MDHNIHLKEYIENDFHISHSITMGWSMKNFHFHDVFEIYYAMSSGVKYFVNDTVYTLEAGDLMIFNSHDLHRSMPVPGEPYDRYILTFIPEYIPDFASTRTDLLECFFSRDAGFSHRRHLSGSQREDLLQLFRKAESYMCYNSYGADIYKKIVLSEILLLVNSFYRSANTIPEQMNEGHYAKIKPVLQFIHQNLSEPLTLNNIAANFYISKYHLGYLFRKVTGFSVNEYIINRRIMRAKELLRSNIPVSQVCEKAGFNNHAHFSRTFKTLTGVSPKKYALNG